MRAYLGSVILVVSGTLLACAPRTELQHPVGATGETEPMRPEVEPAADDADDASDEDASDEADASKALASDEKYQPVQGLAMPFRSKKRSGTSSAPTAAPPPRLRFDPRSDVRPEPTGVEAGSDGGDSVED
jgi:hypothetical protein